MRIILSLMAMLCGLLLSMAVNAKDIPPDCKDYVSVGLEFVENCMKAHQRIEEIQGESCPDHLVRYEGNCITNEQRIAEGMNIRVRNNVTIISDSCVKQWSNNDWHNLSKKCVKEFVANSPYGLSEQCWKQVQINAKPISDTCANAFVDALLHGPNRCPYELNSYNEQCLTLIQRSDQAERTGYPGYDPYENPTWMLYQLTPPIYPPPVEYYYFSYPGDYWQ